MTTTGAVNRLLGLSILLYGGSGTGKTAAINMDGVELIGQAPDQQAVSIRSHGIEGPKLTKARDLLKTTEAMKKSTARIIAIDDAHNIIRDSLSAASGWPAFQKTQYDPFIVAFEELVSAGKIIIFTMHDQDAREGTSKGWQKGGPRLPGTLPEDFCGRCSVVLRTTYSDECEHLTGWPVVVWSRVRKTWLARDRTNTFPDNMPLDLLEGLRVAGYPVSYPKEMKWAESGITEWADKLVKAEDMESAIEDFKGKARDAYLKAQGAFKDQRNPDHARWYIRAAINRALILKARQSNLF